MTVGLYDISYRYAGATAGVQGISFEVASGELVAIVGPSGSGKSTVLKLVAGFLLPAAGRILADVVEVTREAPEKRRLGFVPQNYALFPHMTVGENVAYPLKLRGVGAADRRRMALEMMARVGLQELAQRAPASLSGGQQQRVALARALVFKPRALLLDEPLSALDANLRIAMRDEIRRVQQEAGLATLHVTHDQEEALSIADRLIVMRDGRIEQSGSPMEVYDRPATRFVASFLGQANFLDGIVRDRFCVDTALGPLHCDVDTAFADGTTVTAMIRPERIDFAPAADASAAPNRFAGSVGQDRFLGAVRRFDFRIGAHTLCVETRHRDTPAAVVIPPDAIRILPRADDTPRPAQPTTAEEHLP